MSNVQFKPRLQDQLPPDPAFESQYNLRIRHPERKEIYRNFSEKSRRTRRRPTARLDLPYGNLDTSVLDLFIPEGVEAPPLLIFIHGGYWRALDKNDFSFIADEYLSRGIAVAIPNYELAPRASVTQIVAQVRQAVLHLSQSGSQWGYDDNRIVISGHSAGGHMAAKMACKHDMAQLEHKLLGYVGLSSLFDLEPLLFTSVNHDLHMSASEARALSFYNADELFDVPVVLAAGEQETSGFLRQSSSFSTLLENSGRRVLNLTMPQRNHFDLLADFAACSGASNPLFDNVLEMFGLAPECPPSKRTIMTVQQLNPLQVTAPVGPYSQGVVTRGGGAWLHIAGQIGAAVDSPMPDDFSQQADIAWANVRHVLAEAGMDTTHLIKVVTYVVDSADVPLLGPVRLKHLGEARPAATLVVVNALARPEWKVEVEAVAFKPE